jgi:hypothetical protein
VAFEESSFGSAGRFEGYGLQPVHRLSKVILGL